MQVRLLKFLRCIMQVGKGHPALALTMTVSFNADHKR